MPTSNGAFSGNPKTEWLVNDFGADRDMVLLEDFSFTDPDGNTWHAPKGSVVNGASIPSALWSLVGSPYTDDYRRASVVHDVACDTQGVDRNAADRMFYYACLAGGCKVSQAQVLYAGVRLGTWAASSLRDKGRRADSLLSVTPFDGFAALAEPSASETFLKSTLAAIAASFRLIGPRSASR